MNKFGYADSGMLDTSKLIIDGPMVGSFISAGLGGKNLINGYGVLQNATLPESQEQSKQLIQTLVDVLVDHPKLVEKYYGSGCSDELFEKIIGYHSQKSVGVDNKKTLGNIVLKQIPKEMEQEFNDQTEKWASHDIQAGPNKKPYLEQVQKLQKKYEELYQLNFKKNGLSSEKTREYAVLRNVDNIKGDLLSKYIRKNIKSYKERFLKKLQEDANQSDYEKLSKTSYVGDDLKLYQYISTNLKSLFQKHLMEDITTQIGNKNVELQGDEFKVIQHESRDIFNLQKTQANLKRNSLAFSEDKSKFADHFYNLVGELCVCEYLQDVLSKKIQDHDVQVIKPGALDDIQGKVDMLIILTHKKNGKKKVVRFDLKTTNSLTYLNAESSVKKIRPLWNTSAYLYGKNTETVLSNDVINLSVDPSLMHLLVAQKISNNIALIGQQDAYMKWIFESSSSQIKNSDKNVTNYGFTKDALVQQITRALLS